MPCLLLLYDKAIFRNISSGIMLSTIFPFCGHGLHDIVVDAFDYYLVYFGSKGSDLSISQVDSFSVFDYLTRRHDIFHCFVVPLVQAPGGLHTLGAFLSWPRPIPLDSHIVVG